MSTSSSGHLPVSGPLSEHSLWAHLPSGHFCHRCLAFATPITDLGSLQFLVLDFLLRYGSELEWRSEGRGGELGNCEICHVDDPTLHSMTTIIIINK